MERMLTSWCCSILCLLTVFANGYHEQRSLKIGRSSSRSYSKTKEDCVPSEEIHCDKEIDMSLVISVIVLVGVVVCCGLFIYSIWYRYKNKSDKVDEEQNVEDK